MKKYLFALVLVLFAMNQSSAQMYDEDIIQSVQEKHEAGKSQTAILPNPQRKGEKERATATIKGTATQRETCPTSYMHTGGIISCQDCCCQTTTRETRFF